MVTQKEGTGKGKHDRCLMLHKQRKLHWGESWTEGINYGTHIRALSSSFSTSGYI